MPALPEATCEGKVRSRLKSELGSQKRARAEEGLGDVAARAKRLAKEGRMFPCPNYCVLSGLQASIAATHDQAFKWIDRIFKETSARFGEFAMTMKLEREDVAVPDLNMDRRIIRVDVPPTHAGITAALRRAFEAAASEPSERDFAELLRKLN